MWLMREDSIPQNWEVCNCDSPTCGSSTVLLGHTLLVASIAEMNRLHMRARSSLALSRMPSLSRLGSLCSGRSSILERLRGASQRHAHPTHWASVSSSKMLSAWGHGSVCWTAPPCIAAEFSEMVRARFPNCHLWFIERDMTSILQPGDNAVPRALKATMRRSWARGGEGGFERRR